MSSKSRILKNHKKSFLENATRPLGLHLRSRTEDGSNCLIKDRFQTALSERRTFLVLDRPDFLCQRQTLGVGDWILPFLSQLLNLNRVLAEVGFSSHQDDRRTGTVVRDFRVPLGADVLKGGAVYQAEADEEDVRLRVGEWSQSVVVLLTGGIPETEVDRLSIDENVGRVVVEDRRNVLSGKGVGRVADQQAGLTDGSIAHDDALDCLHRVQQQQLKLLVETFFSPC